MMAKSAPYKRSHDTAPTGSPRYSSRLTASASNGGATSSFVA
jgi:hypothetical protein